MPGAAVPQLLSYATVVDVDMDATNDVNLADAEDYGHRVVVEMSREAANNYLAWCRPVGTDRPVAMLNSLSEAAFRTALVSALKDTYVDIDGVTGGLHFSSAVLSTNPDARIRKDGAVSANDLPLAYVLYKLYGSSTAPTLDKIYNLEDAHEMLSSETVADAVVASLKGQVSGSLDVMFRDLLAADPHRFFDASGVPAVGMFETRTDVFGSGPWKLVANDTLEIKTKLIFKSKVSRRGVAGAEVNVSTPENAAGPQNNQQTVISPDDYFYVRLQLKMSELPVTPGPTPPPGPSSAAFNIVAFTNGGNAPAVHGWEFATLLDFSLPAAPATVFPERLIWNYPALMAGWELRYDIVLDRFYIMRPDNQIVAFFSRPNTSTKIYTVSSDIYDRSTILGKFTITRA
jgi:hypothetical protein